MRHFGHLFSKSGDFTHHTSVVVFLIGRDRYLPVYLGSYVTRTLYALSPTSSACQPLTRDRGDGRPDRFVRRARACTGWWTRTVSPVARVKVLQKNTPDQSGIYNPIAPWKSSVNNSTLHSANTSKGLTVHSYRVYYIPIYNNIVAHAVIIQTNRIQSANMKIHVSFCIIIIIVIVLFELNTNL